MSSSSSASLSELEEEESEPDLLVFSAVLSGFGDADESFMLTSVSRSLLLSLLLVCSTLDFVVSLATFAFLFLLAFFLFWVATLSSVSLLLVSSICFLSSYTFNQSL